ncbi:MAG: hypothetical protein WAO98_01145 [Alphaproteobacteria bacterium]
MPISALDFLPNSWRNLFQPTPALDTSEVERRNSLDDDIKAEFCRRFLPKIVKSEALTIIEQQGMKGVISSFITALPFLAATTLVNPPMGLVIGGAFVIRYLQVADSISEAFHHAGKEIVTNLEEGRASPAIDRWLDKNQHRLSGYLHKLDRYEEDMARVRLLISRINKAGTTDHLLKADRELLAQFGIKRLKPPLVMPDKLPAPYHLGFWWQTRLTQLAWDDVHKKAGDSGNWMKRLLNLSGPA